MGNENGTLLPIPFLKPIERVYAFVNRFALWYAESIGSHRPFATPGIAHADVTDGEQNRDLKNISLINANGVAKIYK
jgi:hypothetical protein